MFLPLLYPLGRCLFLVEGVHPNTIDIILGVIHNNHLVTGNQCNYQTTFNFGKGPTVISAQFVQWTVYQCNSGKWTFTLSGHCAYQTEVINLQVYR